MWRNWKPTKLAQQSPSHRSNSTPEGRCGTNRSSLTRQFSKTKWRQVAVKNGLATSLFYHMKRETKSCPPWIRGSYAWKVSGCGIWQVSGNISSRRWIALLVLPHVNPSAPLPSERSRWTISSSPPRIHKAAASTIYMMISSNFLNLNLGFSIQKRTWVAPSKSPFFTTGELVLRFKNWTEIDFANPSWDPMIWSAVRF